MRDYEFGRATELLEICRNKSVSFKLNYWEASDELEFEVISPAPTECGYIKRSVSISECIELVESLTQPKYVIDQEIRNAVVDVKAQA